MALDVILREVPFGEAEGWPDERSDLAALTCGELRAVRGSLAPRGVVLDAPRHCHLTAASATIATAVCRLVGGGSDNRPRNHYHGGLSVRDISAAVGISYQRVAQIISGIRHGLGPSA
jgi:hypothetical protein